MASASRQIRIQIIMDINYVLSLDDEPVVSEASAGLRRPVLPGIEKQYKKVGSTQQTLDLVDLSEKDNDTDKDDVHPFFASPPVLPRPIPTGQPSWVAATSDPVYRATQLAQERKAEADALQVHAADHGTRLEPIRSYLNSEGSATSADSLILRPMNGPHGVDANEKPFGLPDDFCKEGFEPNPDENTIPHTQQPQSGHSSYLSSTPGHPPHPLPPNESADFNPAVNQSADGNVRQSERQMQPPTTPKSGSRRKENQSLRSTWDSDLRTSNTFSSNHSIYQTRQAQATLAAPPGPTPAFDSQPAQISNAAEETEDVEMADIDDGSDDDLYELTDDGWKVVHSEPRLDSAQQPKLVSSRLSHQAGYESVPSNQYLRPLAPRPPQPGYPVPSTPSPQNQNSPNFTIYQDPPRPSTITQRFAPATTQATRPRSTLPLTTQPSTPHPTHQNPTATHLPTYARGDAKSAVQAWKYIALAITDAPCTRCVVGGQACYRSERGTYWKCAYCQTLRGGRREECVLHE